MPTYEVTLDGKTFELTGDHEPTEAEARQATGLSKQTDEITADSSWGDVGLKALTRAPSDVYELGEGIVSAIRHPVNTMEGIIDIGSSGLSKVLDATGLDKYANQEKMEKYRKYRSAISDELSELATEGGIKKRLANKPITSLLDLSVVGRAVSTPLKAQQYSKAVQKIGNKLNTVSSVIDPTQIITKPASMGFDKIKTIADKKTSQMSDVDAKLANFTNEGFVVPPSSIESTGTIKKITESLLGSGTKNKAIQTNQNIFNKKARIYVDKDIPDSTPLTSLVKFVENKYKGTYDTIKSYKPVVLKKSKTTKGTTQRDTGVLGPNGKPIIEDVPTLSKTKTVYSRNGKEILRDIKDLKIDLAKQFKLAKKKAIKDSQPVDYRNVEKVQTKLNKVEIELETIAQKYGDTDILASLKEAKQSFAKAFNVQNSVKKGNLDATNFYKRNVSNQAPVTGEGRKIMDFVEEYGDVSKPVSKVSPLSKDGIQQGIFQLGKYGGAFAAGGPLGIGGLALAERGIPNLLLGKQSQRALGSGNYMPTGSGLLNALGSRGGVGASTFIPSLLQTTDAENLQYKNRKNPYKWVILTL